MNSHRQGPRFEYREETDRRISNSPSLAEHYPQLKSLVVDLGYFNADGISKNSQIKFTPNLTHARQLFQIACPNPACVGGDFDLTEDLAIAIAQRKTTVSAQKLCPGWQNKTTIDTVHCHNILRYKLTLEY